MEGIALRHEGAGDLIGTERLADPVRHVFHARLLYVEMADGDGGFALSDLR